MNECCWYVKDGGSANGTYLNNIKLSPEWLDEAER
jgi:pSer/pThr/pTyr-binding forkhead associated (FHA) protein